MNDAADTTSDRIAQYAHPERLVTTQWLADHLATPGLVVVESDEDVLLYETGHIPGAVKIDWHTDLNDPDVRDYVDGARFAQLLGSKGITRDTTVVVYGDKGNWWAAYTLWVLSLFGHEDVRLLDGGRGLWIAEGRVMTTDATWPTPVEYPVVERDDTTLRARSGTTCWRTGATRSSTSGRPGSTTASSLTCPTTRMRVRCAQVTSPPHATCHGRRRSLRTAPTGRGSSSRRSTSRAVSTSRTTTR